MTMKNAVNNCNEANSATANNTSNDEKISVNKSVSHDSNSHAKSESKRRD